MAKTSKRQEREPSPAHVRAHPEVPGWGVDIDPKNRPGVPFYQTPQPIGEAHWQEPEPQAPETRRLRPEPRRLTPVFGTAQPPRGLPGAIRQMAYGIPEHRARRWLLLLAADRVEAYGSRLAIGALLAGTGLALWRLRSGSRRQWPARRSLEMAGMAPGV